MRDTRWPLRTSSERLVGWRRATSSKSPSLKWPGPGHQGGGHQGEPISHYGGRFKTSSPIVDWKEPDFDLTVLYDSLKVFLQPHMLEWRNALGSCLPPMSLRQWRVCWAKCVPRTSASQRTCLSLARPRSPWTWSAQLQPTSSFGTMWKGRETRSSLMCGFEW